MKFLKLFKFKIRRKRVHDGIVDVAPQGYKSNNLEEDFTVRKFSWEETEMLTMNCSSSRVIGYGGFSTVYLAKFPEDSRLGAIKIQCSSERLIQVFKQELKILLHLRHPNIVKLLGYCDDREEGVLLFEYMSNGTLQENLSRSSLSWKARMTIAFQLAQAMEYLHDKCSLQIVHGDIKSSNILLDENFNCKLCDFGSAKMGFSSMVLPPSSSMNHRMIVGSHGYLDPHHLKTGLASKKQDIYSFGVIVLELITGMEAFCSKRREKLTSIADPILRDTTKVGNMVDPQLDNKDETFDLGEARAMALIAARCLSDSPSLRPSASEILTILKDEIF